MPDPGVSLRVRVNGFRVSIEKLGCQIDVVNQSGFSTLLPMCENCIHLRM